MRFMKFRNPLASTKFWKRRKHKKALDAYNKVPGLLIAMDNRLQELVQEVTTNPTTFEELLKRIREFSGHYIKTEYPEVWPEIEQFAAENNLSTEDISSYFMQTIVLPEHMEELRRKMDETFAEIVEICKNNVNKELDELNRLKGSKGK